MRIVLIALACLASVAAQAKSGARPFISVEPQALEHYSYCIGQAKDRNSIFDLDRSVMYRCDGDIAVSYYNYLGRKRVPEHTVHEESGVFVYRPVSGVGRCWNKIVDEHGMPVSQFGCDIYVEI